MKIIKTILLLLITLNCFSQEFEYKTDTTGMTDTIKKCDFSQILISQYNFTFGYIGVNYQRLYVRIISVVKDIDAPLEYFVYGKTKVKSNICEFIGKIKINEAGKYLNMGYGDKDTIPCYFSGKYEFFENPSNQHSGIFIGKVIVDFLLIQNKVILDETLMGADGYFNLQYEGTWTSYDKTISKKANWGDYRIPDSKDLDVGAGEFIPNEKYIQYGWENYYKSRSFDSDKPETKDAIKKEKGNWWK